MRNIYDLRKCIGLTILAFIFSANAHAQVITAFAGRAIPGYSGDGGPATAALLRTPDGTAFDNHGNFYIADAANNVIRKVDVSGVITTFAGNGTAGSSGNNGPATAATLWHPVGLAADKYGNVFLSDSSNTVRRIDPAGIITTFAGNGTLGYSGDGGQATAAALNRPAWMTTDKNGNLYFGDFVNNVIRKVDLSGKISTVAGNTSFGFGGDGGPATAAKISLPLGLVVDETGSLFICDQLNRRIRKVDSLGIITTVAGSSALPNSGDNGPATAAGLDYPDGITVDRSGNLYIDDFGPNRVRKVNTAGIITAFAGNGIAGYSGDNGPATAASFNGPNQLVIDSVGNIFISDRGNAIVRKITNPSLATHSPCEASLSFNIFPNPSDGNFAFNVVSPFTEDATVQIFNSTGITVATQVVKTNCIVRFEDKLPPGCYIVRAFTATVFCPAQTVEIK